MAHVIHLDHRNSRLAAPGLLAGLRRAVADLRTFVAIRRELDGFTDAELADIGLSRVTVRDTARQAAYGS